MMMMMITTTTQRWSKDRQRRYGSTSRCADEDKVGDRVGGGVDQDRGGSSCVIGCVFLLYVLAIVQIVQPTQYRAPSTNSLSRIASGERGLHTGRQLQAPVTLPAVATRKVSDR
eukprot:3933429-Rhodomonas_salina.1